MKSFLTKQLCNIRVFALSICSFFSFVSLARAWTPLIVADDFLGIQTDVMTTAAGVISIVLIIIAVSYLVRALTN